MKDIAEDMHDTSVYTDKAYVSKILKKFIEEQDIVLNTPVKNKGHQFNMTDEIISTNVSRSDSQLSPCLAGLTKKQASKQLQRHAQHKDCLFMSMEN